jgi:cyclase
MSISRRVLLADALILAGGLCAGRTTLGAAARRRAGLLHWDAPTPGAFVSLPQDLRTGGNSLVVVGADASLVVDCKFVALGFAVRHQGEAHGVPIATVVNTHHHADHTGGNVAFRDVEVLAHENAAPRILAQTNGYIAQVQGARLLIMGTEGPDADAANAGVEALLAGLAELGPESWAPGRPVGARTTIDLHPHAVDLHHFGPGHTDNDLVAHVPDLNLIHAGDLVFHRLHPFVDVMGGATARGWIEALRQVLALCDNRTIVVPGHGDMTDAAGVRGQIEYLEQAWEHVEREVRAGKSRDEVAGMSWPFMDGLGFERVRERALRAIYDEVAAAVDR